MIIIPSSSRSEVSTELQTFDGHTYDANDEILAKRCADLLNKHYPGHLWAVNVNATPSGGCLFIKNFSISFRYGYTLHINKLDPELKKVLRAGGEILERAKMKRGLWNGENAKRVDGLPDRHQPIERLGIVI